MTGLLGLLGLQADPLQSRDHILLSNLLEAAWSAGESLDLPALIQRIQSPPLRRVGVFELDSFYPAPERFKLAMLLNNLLAAPGFASWLEGDTLEIDSLLFTPAGKPRLSILSIAHLTDAERMFFVTILLNQLLGWMRKQAGTASLRALFYMDEIFGFFPPVSEPASKRPLLTLLKQARAFGLGLVLTTQNPVDLDYKGLANAGTWFIGRLQTDNDKERLLDGLAGVGGNIDLRQVSSLISGLKKRVFLMHNVHEDRPVLMNTRWTLSYLRGPLTRQQIGRAMAAKKSEQQAPAAAQDRAPARPAAAGPESAQRPHLPPGVSELFVQIVRGTASPGRLVYHPALAAFGQAALVDNRLAISSVQAAAHYFELTEDILGLLWDRARPFAMKLEDLSREPQEPAFFLPLPEKALRLLKPAGSDYADFLARTLQLNLWKSPLLQVLSGPGESERDFRVRLAQLAREKRDGALETLRQKYAPRIASLERQLLVAEQRLQREQEQYRAELAQTAISTGATILGAILGRKTSPLGRATTSARGASRSYYEKMDIERAKQQVEFARARLFELQKTLEEEAARLTAGAGGGDEPLQTIALRPKRRDTTVQWTGVLWLPFRHLESGSAEPGFSDSI